MKLLDVDGPIIGFLSNAFDFFMIFLLTVLLSLPVITAGAAMTAGQYVAMKIMRKEAPKVFPSFFKAFKENFKQSTIMWVIQLVFIGFLLFDWSFVIQIGWNNINVIYKALLILASCVVLFYNMMLYAVIARFVMNFKDTVKTTMILSLANFPFLALTAVIFAGTVFLCIWFFNLLPVFFVIGFTGATAFHGFVTNRACEKLRKKMEEVNSQEEETEE